MNMKKTFKLWLALALLTLTGSQAWAEDTFTRSFTITFNDNGMSQDNSTAIAADEDINNFAGFSRDDASLELASFEASRAFKAKQDWGLKLGTASAPGSITFTLNKKVKITQIQYSAAQFDADERVVIVNDSTKNNEDATPLESNFNNYTVIIDEKQQAETDKITIATPDSARRAYIQNVTVTYESSELAPISTNMSIWGGENISERLKASIESYKENGNYLKDFSLYIYGNCTITEPIEAAGVIRVYGYNNSIIDASELKGPFAQFATGMEANSEISQVYFSGVHIENLAYQLFYANKQKVLVNDVTIYNSIIGIKGAAKKTIIDFNGAGQVRNLYITNSTLFADETTTWQNGGLFSTQSAQRISDYDEDVTQGYHQWFNISNNTFYRICNGQNAMTHRQNSQSWQSFTVKNNIIVNGGKKAQFLKGLNGGQPGKNENWINEDGTSRVSGNIFNFDGEVVAEQKIGSKDDNIQNSIEEVVKFADAENGDFTLEEGSQAALWFVGDKRWNKTKIGNNYYSLYWENEDPAYNPTYRFRFYDASRGYYTSSARSGSPIRMEILPQEGYSVRDVKAIAYANWGNAKAPRRAGEQAIGMLKDVELTQINDTAYYFIMPEALVKATVSYTTNVDASWISYSAPGTVEIFEGETANIDDEIVLIDYRKPVLDEDGNQVYVENEYGNMSAVYYQLELGKDYTIEYNEEEIGLAGTTKAVIKGMGDYSGTLEIPFTITKKIIYETVGDDVAGNFTVEVLSEEAQIAYISAMMANEGETTFTIPAEVDGYQIVAIADGAMLNLGDVKEINMPEGAPILVSDKSFTPTYIHPSKTPVVNVTLENLDDYADMLPMFTKNYKVKATVKQTAEKFWTFSSRTAVLLPEGLKANIVKYKNDNEVEKVALGTQYVKAAQGILLEGEKDAEYVITAIDAVPNQESKKAANYEENLLVAVLDAWHFDAGEGYYILKGGQFVAIADSENAEVPANKAVLHIVTGTPAAVIAIAGGEATGINTLAIDAQEGNWYDLNGRKLEGKPSQKGIYILNGKKVVLK